MVEGGEDDIVEGGEDDMVEGDNGDSMTVTQPEGSDKVDARKGV